MPQSVDAAKSAILFRPKALKMGSVVQAEFAGRQFLEMAEHKVCAVTYAIAVGVAGTELQPSDKQIVPSAAHM